MKVLKEKKHKKEDEVSLWEIVKQMRSRGAQKDEATFQEDKRKENKKSKLKVFKEKKHQKDDEVLLSEIVKEKRSRGVQKDLAIFQANNEKESSKAKTKVFKEKEHQKEDVIFLGENLREKKSEQVVLKGQAQSKRRLKYEGKQAMDTRCNQRKMHKFLSNLKGTKRSIIENSIFSAFLDIPGRPVHRQLVAALIECFDAKMDAIIIAGQPLKFCGREIEECIGLSFEGKRVDLNFQSGNIAPSIAWKYFEIVEGNASIKNESKGVNEDMENDRKMISSLRVCESLLLQKLNVMSVDGKSEADDFLRLSILYMFNVFFFPNGGRYISWWPLKYLENLEDFNSYAWGCVVYDYLHLCLVKAARILAGKNEVHTCMGGCIPLLEILVCERISKLQVSEHQKNLHPLVLNYSKKRDVNSFYSFRKLLAKLQPNEIKKCEHCEKDLKK